MDAPTTRWIRNPSDERAVKNGCRVDELRGAWACWWVETQCTLYQGEDAGKPLTLHGCHECGDYGLPNLRSASWNEETQRVALERAKRHCACVRKGHRVDWQYECVFRLYAWVRYSPQWKREIRRFREGVIVIGKKNKKSPTLAANALYLLCGDGEQGQNVYLAAKNGAQAREIAGTHTVEMRNAAPSLRRALSLNKSTLQLTHRQSRSRLRPLASDSVRSQEASEGLNGSVCLDEFHVASAEFLGRISRAGISRSEPLFLEFSTAGDNPDGYGRKRFEYAQKVEQASPGYENDELFVAIYAAPQDLSDEDLEADPLKWGYMANPAMGHTVNPDEYLRDYQQSKQKGLLELARFKQYRLNVWQRSSSPWIPSALWLACRQAFTLQDLAGRDCWAGLDLSRTRDMSALVLCFAGDADDEYLLLPFFWLPKQRVQELKHLGDFLEWEKAGFLEVTPGAVVDYGLIEDRIREIARIVTIVELAYDPRFAEELTQNVAEGRSDGEGKTARPGVGLERYVFEQNDDNFAAPTQDFERLIRAGKLRHPDHPVLNWQIGNAHVKERPTTKVKRVVKPPLGWEFRTIDGVVGGVMALARAMQARGVGTGGVEVWE
jgi:phage terminase large subunit-like protein